jgi:hypothetical protein
MFPDIPPLKHEIAKKLQASFKQLVNGYMGAINEAPRYFIKEGRRVVTIRPDGQIDETELKAASVETTINFAEVPFLSFQDRIAKLDEAAQEMAKQISEHAFAQINEAVERVGNSINGQYLSPETFFEVLEKIHLDFDGDGGHSPLTVLIPPSLVQQAKETLEKLHQNPEYKVRYEEIITKKRMEWRDREAARKLVG